MTVFEYVTAALLLILGIGVTQLLTDVVDAFRRRQTTPLDWIPMTWAALVFAAQMQFVWAVYELNGLRSAWTAVEFTGVLLLALLLFVAGALVVPRASDEATDAWTQFLQDGRWALLVLIAFFVAAYVVNIGLFDESPLSVANLENLVLAALLAVILRSRSRRAWRWLTLLFVVLYAISIGLLSPASYG
ncbi:MAG: hypothetical protein R2991_02605 [Thermoanaerobaculia bacterium]